MQSSMFRLGLKDLLKGLIVSVLTAVLLYIQTAMTAPEFSFLAINWVALLNVSAAAGLGYLIKNFISDSDGSLLGFWGGKKEDK